MKKTTTFLCSLLMLFSAVATPFSVMAEEAATETEATAVETTEDESAKHSNETPIEDMEECDRILGGFEGEYAIGDDGFFYSTVEYGDYFIEQYEANPGTYDRTFLLRALLYKYPEASFAVQMEVSIWGDSFSSYDDVVTWLKENGVLIAKTMYSNVTPCDIYAVLTAEQLADFPTHEELGFKIGLAPKMLPDPTLLGDANADDSFDLVDVVCLQRYLIGQVEMDTTQLANSDITRDGKVNGFDLAAMKKMYLES